MEIARRSALSGCLAALAAPDLASQQAVARDSQGAAFLDLPYCPLGTFRQPYAWRRDATGRVRAPIPCRGT